MILKVAFANLYLQKDFYNITEIRHTHIHTHTHTDMHNKSIYIYICM